MTNRDKSIAAAVLVAAGALACAAQPRSDLRRLYAAEDARPTTAAALEPIFALLKPATEPTTLAMAVRALGRLQRAAFIDSLTPFLAHAEGHVRAEAANAIAQSVQPGRDTSAIVRARELLIKRAAVAAADDRGPLLRSVGRLPHESQAVAQEVAERIARVTVPSVDTQCASVRQAPSVPNVAPSLMFGAMHGIYSAARRARTLGCAATNVVRAAMDYRAAGDTAAWVRELALLTLQTTNRADTTVLDKALRDSDPRVRRVALRPPRETPPGYVLRLATAGLADSAAIVRIDAVRALAGVRTARSCDLARGALQDRAAYVRSEAVDAVAAACGDTVAAALLDSLVRLLPADTASASGSWHVPARALIGLARTSPTHATPHFAHFRMHPVWQVRAALAAAARATGDSGILLELLGDRDANVREETIALLAQLEGSLRERAVTAGLAASEYQVVLAAATAAKHVPSIDATTLASALERLTRDRRETSRDPRRELLERIAERGSAADTALLRSYLADFDTVIARRSAEVLTRWSGRPVSAAPRPLPSRSESFARHSDLHLRITLSPASGGGTWLVRLFPTEAPATVARVVRLADAGYYNGRTLHRVVPNFVIQGGSPDANEYVGDGPFMRDELGLRSHTRGTLGISTRGRDTGDAQIFVNLVDNFRLDHDYTVFGEVVEGMEVVDQIQAGAVLHRVEVLRGPR